MRDDVTPDQGVIDFEARRRAAAMYPEHAGAKEKGATSQEAAKAIEASGRAQTLRERVLAWFVAGHESTADEIAAALDEPILAIRPRCSELRKQGRIVTTGRRRQSAGGKMAHVWRLKRSEEC